MEIMDQKLDFSTLRVKTEECEPVYKKENNQKKNKEDNFNIMNNLEDPFNKIFKRNPNSLR